MGTKVQLDNYFSMRDLNHDLNGTSWPSYCGENNLPNGQYYYGVLPRPNPDLFPGVDKDFLKQKMLEHEALFKNQVFELHRLYRVQRDLMDEIRKKDDFKHKAPYETSSSSSPLASQTTPDDAHKRTSSSFLFSNSVCGGPPVSGPEFVGSSAGGSSLKGKNVQGDSVRFTNCASPRNSEVSESRPTKSRRMIDLQLPADEYLDVDEVEQCKNIKYQEIAPKPSECMRKLNALADLNEPPETEETALSPSNDFLGVRNKDLMAKTPAASEEVIWKPNHGNINGTHTNSCYNDKGNGESWFSSMLKPGGTNRTNHFEKEPLHLRPVHAVLENPHQPSGLFPRHHVKEDPWPANANDSFNMFDRSRGLSSYDNSGVFMGAQLPSYAPSSSLVNSLDPSRGKPSTYQGQKPISVQTTPFMGSASLIKSSQSSAQGNDFHATWCHRNGYGSKTSVQNGFYHGSASGWCKELPSQSKPSMDYVKGSHYDKPISGSRNFLKGRNFFDLNSTGDDLNLNVSLPNDLSDESLTPQGEVKRDDHISALPWLRAKTSNNEASSSISCPKRSDARNVLDHQDPSTSTSNNVDTKRGKKELLLDINVPCDDPEEFVNVAAESEVLPVEHEKIEKIETRRPNDVPHLIDLNSCLTEDEIPARTSLTNSSTTTNSTKRPERCIIDLEAPINLEDDEEITNCVAADDELAEKLARVAAEAIVTISSSIPENRVEDETAASEDALRWFVDIVFSCPDEVKSCRDSFEEMTLKLTECTVEEYFPNPPDFNFPTMEETGRGPASVTGRARRGPARRGRQRRDFQRDILPGLGTLARHEVTEDLQTFGGLMRATGHAWQCGTRRNSSRNGSRRGRRKAAAAVPLPPPPATDDATTTTFASSEKNSEITALEDRSLTSWGKTTRRPRRQRCPPTTTGSPAPIAMS